LSIAISNEHAHKLSDFPPRTLWASWPKSPPLPSR
jgi:hypothetical protein